MSKESFQVLAIEESDCPGAHHIIFTGADGVIRQSLDVYGSFDLAERDMAALKDGGILPDWWDVYTPAA